MKYFFTLIKNIDRWLIFIVLCFLGISVVMISSTAYTGSFVLTRKIVVQIVAYLLGFFLLGVILLLDYRVFEKMEKIIYVGSLLFLLTVYTPLGDNQYGAQGWLKIGPLNLQPAELVKVAFILVFANYLCRHMEELQTLKSLIKCGLYLAPFVLLVLIQNDLGNALVFCVIAAVMIFMAGVNGKLYAGCIGAVAAAMPIAYQFMASHQKERIDAFLNPNNLDLPGNYHVWMSKVAIGSGGLLGKGLFKGTQKELKFLPVQESDFIFAVIVEELGFLGGGIVIGLYGAFLYRILKIAHNAKDYYGGLIAIGIFAMFLFQIFENIGMTMGVMPVTGITLPFISYGGSSIVTNMVSLALVLNIGMRSKLINF